MLRHKNIDRVCCVVLALTLLLSTLFVGAAASGIISSDGVIGYETRLFDQSRVHTIDIVMDDWESFVSTATTEEYSACHLVIDGESYKNVAIRGKGNTSLSSVASYGNDRYSFKVEFDHYQSGATYHGLDKLSLNNLIQDNTFMKDYFAYTMMNKMGVAAPLCSFVQISVNGEPWGLYLAVEGVEDAFLRRNYGTDHGELYKPDSMSFGGGRGNGRDFDIDEMAERFGLSFGDDSGEMPAMPTDGAMPDMNSMPQMPDGFDPSQMGGGMTGDVPASEAPAMPTDGTMPDMNSAPQMPGGFDSSQMGGGMTGDASASEAPAMPTDGAMPDMNSVPQMPGGFDPSQMGGSGGADSSSDVKLQYSDDDPASYANIFDNAKTDVTEADQNRLIASLKALGEGDTSVVDTEAVIRYMAVHNFLCNDDSYTGMMVHNYYLYEEDGVLAMIPWDYNLAYGTMSGSNATSAVNADIDTLVTGGSASDRPMASWITASEEYAARYRAVYQEFVTTVFESGWFAEEIDRVTAMISPYVQNDPTAFCTHEEFLTGAETLKQFCLKRAQSVAGQLQGDDARVDASDLTLSDMGTMGNMGGQDGGRGGFGGRNGKDAAPSAPTDGADDGMLTLEMPTAPAESAAPAGNDAHPAASAEAPADDPMRASHDSGFSLPGSSRQSASQWGWLAACIAVLCAGLAFAGVFRSQR